MSERKTTSEEKVARLHNQINWITRVSAALSSVGKVDDAISIILAGIVAPTGMGYSQVLFFDFDSVQNMLVGKTALYHDSLDSMASLGVELEEEGSFLEARFHESTQGDSEDLVERLRSEADFHWLSGIAQWVTLFQRLNPENSKSNQLKRLSFSTHSTSGKLGTGVIFEEALHWRRPRLFSKTALGSRLPHALAALLPEQVIFAPLATNKGLRGLLILDRQLEPSRTIDYEELRELDWFCRQATLAIENVEMQNDLARAYQEIKNVDQMKSNFLSIISHELRTPLTAMTGFVELILDGRVGDINENQRTLLTRVSRNTGHLNNLVNDLIELAEIEAAGSVEVRLESIEPLTVLLDTLPKLELRRRDKNVRVIPVIECEVPRIYADERSLERILFHLIDNAMKFSPDNGTVEVRLRSDDTEFHVDICDHGVGIAPENIKHIFKHFYQVDNTLTRGHEGLGLGLAVSKMLVQANRARISVESEVGRGSTFTVSFPIQQHPN